MMVKIDPWTPFNDEPLNLKMDVTTCLPDLLEILLWEVRAKGMEEELGQQPSKVADSLSSDPMWLMK